MAHLQLVREPQRPALTWRAAVGGALGGAAIFADIAAPGLAPLVDLGIGAATAYVAVDAAFAIARRRDTEIAPRQLIAESVRVARQNVLPRTAAAALLALASDVLDDRKASLAPIAARAMWSAARWLIDHQLADFVPGAATVLRATQLASAIRDGAAVVGAIEAAAERVCRRAELRASSNVVRQLQRPHARALRLAPRHALA